MSILAAPVSIVYTVRIYVYMCVYCYVYVCHTVCVDQVTLDHTGGCIGGFQPPTQVIVV